MGLFLLEWCTDLLGDWAFPATGILCLHVVGLFLQELRMFVELLDIFCFLFLVGGCRKSAFSLWSPQIFHLFLDPIFSGLRTLCTVIPPKQE